MTWANKLSFVLICVVMVFTVMAYGTVHQPVIAVFYFLVIAIAVLWAVDGYISRSVRYSTSLLQVVLFSAGLYGLIQVIPFGTLPETGGVAGIPRTIALDPFATQVSALHYIALGLFFSALLVCLHTASRIRTLVTVITVFGFGYAFFAILQSVLSPDKIYGIYETRFAQPFGTFVNRHNFAAFMEMALAVPLGLLFVGAISKDKRLLYFTAVALMGIALLLSGSRGGFVALIAEVIVLVFLTAGASGKKSFALKAGLALLLIGAVIAGTFFVGGESSLTRLTETAGSKDVTTNRTHIWNVTTSVITHNLPFGAGIGSFGPAYTPYDTFNGLERVEQAHNDYLQVLADAGIVGLLIGGGFIFLLVITAMRSIKTTNRYRRGVAVGAVAGCTAILVHSVFDFVLHTTAIAAMFLTLLGLLVASGDDYEDDVADRESGMDTRRHRSASVSSISEGRRSFSRR